jgi:hypothetical protein
MKIFALFLLILSATWSSSFSQECKIDANPLPPHKDFVGSKSVGIKYDIIKFYSVPDSSKHLLYFATLYDVFKRTASPGDSVVILLKNKHKIKLSNLRTFNYKFDKMNMGVVSIDLFPINFIAWISKEDVKQMADNSIKRVRYFTPVEENNFEKQILKPNSKEKVYFQPTLGIIHRKNIKKVANCALTL